MIAHFVVEFLVCLFSTKQRSQSQWNRVYPMFRSHWRSVPPSNPLSFFQFEFNDPRNRIGQPAPVVSFLLKLPPPQSCQRIAFRSTTLCGRHPLGGNPALLLQLV